VSKRVILCFDGEWDRPPDAGARTASSKPILGQSRSSAGSDVRSATNVFQLFQSILPHASDGRVQQKWYEPGTGVRWFHRFREGAFGYELDRTILQGYAYLAATYDPGDEVYIYGFSRGAYTARSLVGLLALAGLPLPTVLNGHGASIVREAARALASSGGAVEYLHECLTGMIIDPDDHAINDAYGMYRALPHTPEASRRALSRHRGAVEVPVAVLGLWDTVGPLGIPTSALKWLNEHRYNFRDTELSPIVHQAYHALAIDEHRADHNATLWTSPAKTGQVIEQRWFAGSHGDLGGIYLDRRMADVSLAWIQRNSAAQGLAIEPSGIPETLNVFSPIHDSFRESFVGFRKWLHPRFYRPVMQTGTGTEVLDGSVRARLINTPPYRPKNEGLNNLLTFPHT